MEVPRSCFICLYNKYERGCRFLWGLAFEHGHHYAILLHWSFRYIGPQRCEVDFYIREFRVAGNIMTQVVDWLTTSRGDEKNMCTLFSQNNTHPDV